MDYAPNFAFKNPMRTQPTTMTASVAIQSPASHSSLMARFTASSGVSNSMPRIIAYHGRA